MINKLGTLKAENATCKARIEQLEKALEFYRDLLGFEVMQDAGSAVFLSAGGYHHTIGLNTWSAEGARKPEEGQIGLYHFAVLYPSRKELAKVAQIS